MYTALPHDAIMEGLECALKAVVLPTTCDGDGVTTRGSARNRTAVVLPRSKGRMKDCFFGREYGFGNHVVVTFEDMRNVTKWANARSIMYVAGELRRYHVGIPMGAQSSCSSANGLAMMAEMKADDEWARRGGATQRNVSLAFMDDLYMRVLYDDEMQGEGWTRESAGEYMELLKTAYPDGLDLE
jgi:hypothetical protein